MKQYNESALMRKCCQYMDKFDNILYWHDNSRKKNKPGKLDLEIHIQHYYGDVITLLIELKVEGGRLRDEQKIWLDFFKNSQITRAFVVDDFNDFCDIINKEVMLSKKRSI